MNLSLSSNYSNVCRTCLFENPNMKSLFALEQIMEQELPLCEFLMSCVSIEIMEGDGLPEKICESCCNQINNVFKFIKQCEKSDSALRQYLSTMKTLTPLSTVNDFGQFEDRCKADEKKTITSELEDCIKDSEKCELDNIIKEYVYSEPSNKDPKELVIKDIVDQKKKEIGTDEFDEEDNIGDIDDTDSEKSCSSPKVRKKFEETKCYMCKICDEECLDLPAYRKHMADVHGVVFKCEICGKEFKSKNVLARHIKSAHIASQNNTRKSSKTRINKTGIIKKRNLPRTCDICNKTFRFHSNLERHKLIHTGEKPYLCNVCGKGFAQLSYLKIHSFIHTGEKPYNCHLCDKRFAAPGTLMTHVRTHTGERPHICKICGKDFPQSGYLSAHIRTHTGEKPVECKVCHRRFNQSGRLIIHMRIHSGEKPYQCQECGRSFAVKGTLKKHIRTHTGERPYICSACGQAFAQSGTLATHMKVHKAKQ